MRRLIKAGGFALCLSVAVGGFQSTVATAEEQEWKALYGCFAKHKADVARVVVSLQEGAELVVDSLCQKESTDLINALLLRPIFKANPTSPAIRGIILREVKASLYLQKKEAY